MLPLELITDDLVHLSLERPVAERIAPVMARYVDELYRGNDRFGLISREDATDPERLLRRHVLDSIAPWRIVADLLEASGRRRLFDLGSGAGLPGIPLAYVLSPALPGTLDETVLVERRSKRVAFLLGVLPGLRRTCGDTSAPIIRALEVDTGHLPTREPNPLSDAAIVFRAYQQTSEELLLQLARVFGPAAPVCALKGKTEQAQAELRVLQNSPHADRGEIHSIAVPGDSAERSVLTWYTAEDTE